MFEGCILVLEYIHFLAKTKVFGDSVLEFVVKEYESSGTQAMVINDLQHAIKEHDNDQDLLQKVIINIILNHRMCKLLPLYELLLFNHIK